MVELWYVPEAKSGQKSYCRVRLSCGDRIIVAACNRATGAVTVTRYNAASFHPYTAFPGQPRRYENGVDLTSLSQDDKYSLTNCLRVLSAHSAYRELRAAFPGEDFSSVIRGMYSALEKVGETPAAQPAPATAQPAPVEPKVPLFVLRDAAGLESAFAEGNFYKFSIDGEYIVLLDAAGQSHYVSPARGRFVEVPEKNANNL